MLTRSNFNLMSNKKPYTTVSNSNKSEEKKEKKGRRKRSDEIANSILSAECCTATTECPLSIVFVTGARSLIRTLSMQRERIASRYR